MTSQSEKYKETLSRYLANHYKPTLPVSKLVMGAYRALGDPMPTASLTQDIVYAIRVHAKKPRSSKPTMEKPVKVKTVRATAKKTTILKNKSVTAKPQRDSAGKFMRKDHPDFVGVDGKTNRQRNLEIRNMGQQRSANGGFLKKTDPTFIHADGLTTAQKLTYSL